MSIICVFWAILLRIEICEPQQYERVAEIKMLCFLDWIYLIVHILWTYDARTLHTIHLTCSKGESVAIKGHTGAVRSVNFSSDSQYLITSSDDKTAKVSTSTYCKYRTRTYCTWYVHQDALASHLLNICFIIIIFYYYFLSLDLVSSFSEVFSFSCRSLQLGQVRCFQFKHYYGSVKRSFCLWKKYKVRVPSLICCFSSFIL